MTKRAIINTASIFKPNLWRGLPILISNVTIEARKVHRSICNKLFFKKGNRKYQSVAIMPPKIVYDNYKSGEMSRNSFKEYYWSHLKLLLETSFLGQSDGRLYPRYNDFRRFFYLIYASKDLEVTLAGFNHTPDKCYRTLLAEFLVLEFPDSLDLGQLN
jgi:hypothetical protein